MKFAPHIEQLEESATLAISQQAQELKEQGIDIISLSVGEPDFDTPFNVKATAINAINNNETNYTTVSGTSELKQAIITYLGRTVNLEYNPKQIIVSTGSKQSLYNSLQVLLHKGDEVIIPAPYWVSYPAMVKLCGGVPCIVNTIPDSGYKITPQQLSQAITPKTKAIILNTPNNPSGAIYSEEELTELAKVMRKHPNVWLICDEVYRYLCFSQNLAPSILQVAPDLTKQTLIFDSTSKSFCMTGWRIGFCAGPSDVIKAMGKLQSQSTSCPNSIAQAAAVEAFTNADDYAFSLIDRYRERHDYLYGFLNSLPGIKIIPSAGPFYLLPDCSELISKLKLNNDVELASFLLEKANVATVPGSAFGADNHIRLSFAVGIETLKDAVNRISEALENSF